MCVELINSGIQPFHNLSTLNHVREQLKADEKAWAAHWVGVGLASLETLAQRFAGSYLVGDTFTWADACLVPQLMGARRFGADVTKYPTLQRIEATCLALEWVQRAKPEAQPDAQPV